MQNGHLSRMQTLLRIARTKLSGSGTHGMLPASDLLLRALVPFLLLCHNISFSSFSLPTICQCTLPCCLITFRYLDTLIPLWFTVRAYVDAVLFHDMFFYAFLVYQLPMRMLFRR